MTMKKKMASHQDGLELLLRASLPSPLFILYCVQAFFFFFFFTLFLFYYCTYLSKALEWGIMSGTFLLAIDKMNLTIIY